MSIHPVILSGGSGTRLWPLSRKLTPKQLLPLTSQRTLLQQTASRVSSPQFAPPLVICNAEHRFLVAEQLRAEKIEPSEIVLEPVGRNTAPAAAVAALLLAERDPDAQLLLLPSDHLIEDVDAFHAAVRRASSAAALGRLVTFGIRPDRPETGYGYIQRGFALSGASGCFAVTRFIEKPELQTARALLDRGGYTWNSGMFLMPASVYLEELERHRPEMLEACRAALKRACRDADFLRLDPELFAGCPADSIDCAVMERTERAAVVPTDLDWNDVGAWSALWDVAPKDSDGNAVIGDVVAEQVRNSYLRSEGPLLATIGLDDVVVVATTDAVLVAPKSRAQEVKALVDRLRDGASGARRRAIV